MIFFKKTIFFSDARIRAGEIVKGSRSGQTSNRGSPERALLSNETTPMHHRSTTNQNNDNGSIYTENIDLSSPGFNNRNIINEPPRNIFDDI